MEQKSIFLDHPIRIIPIEGETSVSIVTTGEYIIAKSSTCDQPRVRSITLADTGKAVLTKSPQGANRTVKIILASEEASEEEFVRQVKLLFDAMSRPVTL